MIEYSKMITSSSNPTIKMIRKLRTRKVRDESGLFYIEGTRIVKEALEENEDIQFLIWYLTAEKSEVDKITIQLARKKGIPCLEVSEQVYQSFSLREGSQRISAVVRQKWVDFEEISQKLNRLWIGLFEISDPGNLGTILRTMDAVGVKGLVLIGNCTDPYDPTAVRASMGALFTKNITRIDTKSFEKWISSTKCEVIGTSDRAVVDFRDIQYPKNGMLLMGSEREGLPESIMKQVTNMVRIPMLGKNDSLNLAVATSVVLYEIQRQNLKTLEEL